jgi:chromate transporter
MTSDNFSSPDENLRQFVISVIIFLAAFVATKKYKVNPILMIVLCGLAGGLLY